MMATSRFKIGPALQTLLQFEGQDSLQFVVDVLGLASKLSAHYAVYY